MATGNPNEILFQRRCAKFVYIVPCGLTELMNDITREVLRHDPQPPNIYHFIANYLDCLMVVRENARIAQKLVNNVTETGFIVASILDSTKMTKEKADKAARIIQRAYKSYCKNKKNLKDTASEPSETELTKKILRRMKLSSAEANHAASVIQRSYKKYKRYLGLCHNIDWRQAMMTAMKVLKSTKATQEEMSRAATLIKSAYKGYYTRRMLKKLVYENRPIIRHAKASEEISDEVQVYSFQLRSTSGEVAEEEDGSSSNESSDDEKDFMEKAAVIIQKAFSKSTVKDRAASFDLDKHLISSTADADKELLKYMQESSQKIVEETEQQAALHDLRAAKIMQKETAKMKYNSPLTLKALRVKN